MSAKTVSSVVAHFQMLKGVSYSMYISTVNQFLSIIEGNDDEGIAKQYYPGKNVEFFQSVLKELGELD